MFDPGSLLPFVLAGLALNLTPRPDLLYITARSLAQGAPAAAMALRPVAPDSMRKVFWQGLATNAMNAKVALFFLAFLPQFADPARGAVADAAWRRDGVDPARQRRDARGPGPRARPRPFPPVGAAHRREPLR